MSGFLNMILQTFSAEPCIALTPFSLCVINFLCAYAFLTVLNFFILVLGFVKMTFNFKLLFPPACSLSQVGSLRFTRCDFFNLLVPTPYPHRGSLLSSNLTLLDFQDLLASIINCLVVLLSNMKTRVIV